MKNLSATNLRSMTCPAEASQILAMLQEASSEIDNINAHLDAVIRECEQGVVCA